MRFDFHQLTCFPILYLGFCQFSRKDFAFLHNPPKCANLVFCCAFVYYLFTSLILLIHKFYFCHFSYAFCLFLALILVSILHNQLYALVDFIPHMSQYTSSKAVAGQHSSQVLSSAHFPPLFLSSKTLFGQHGPQSYSAAQSSCSNRFPSILLEEMI